MAKVDLRRLMLSFILIAFSFSCTKVNTEGNPLSILNITDKDGYFD
jgi:hypothetical protein